MRNKSLDALTEHYKTRSQVKAVTSVQSGPGTYIRILVAEIFDTKSENNFLRLNKDWAITDSPLLLFKLIMK